jgi:hypothetical protein
MRTVAVQRSQQAATGGGQRLVPSVRRRSLLCPRRRLLSLPRLRQVSPARLQGLAVKQQGALIVPRLEARVASLLERAGVGAPSRLRLPGGQRRGGCGALPLLAGVPHHAALLALLLLLLLLLLPFKDAFGALLRWVHCGSRCFGGDSASYSAFGLRSVLLLIVIGNLLRPASLHFSRHTTSRSLCSILRGAC